VAINILKEGLDDSPNDPVLPTMLADYISATGEHQKGLEIAAGALKQWPADPNIHVVLAIIHFRMNQFKEAMRHRIKAYFLFDDATELGARGLDRMYNELSRSQHHVIGPEQLLAHLLEPSAGEKSEPRRIAKLVYIWGKTISPVTKHDTDKVYKETWRTLEKVANKVRSFHPENPYSYALSAFVSLYGFTNSSAAQTYAEQAKGFAGNQGTKSDLAEFVLENLPFAFPRSASPLTPPLRDPRRAA
jgi:tetratricopeptide (TPR) repeat protein